MSHNEPSANRTNALPPLGAGADVVRTTMRLPDTLGGFAQKARKSAPIRKKTTPVEPAPQVGHRGEPNGATFHHQFMEQLRREKQRANRTHSPLSLALFRVERMAGSAGGKTAKWLYDIIDANRRETDIAAQLGDDLVAVLLLDTDNRGAQTYTQRMLALARNLAVSTIEQTYPDYLFDNLEVDYQEIASADDMVPDYSPAGRRKNIPELLTAAKEKWLGVLKLAID